MSCKLTDIPAYNTEVKSSRIQFNIEKALDEKPKIRIPKGISYTPAERYANVVPHNKVTSLSDFIIDQDEMGYAFDITTDMGYRYGDVGDVPIIDMATDPIKYIFDITDNFARTKATKISADFSIPYIRSITFSDRATVGGSASMGDGRLSIAADQYNKILLSRTKLTAEQLKRTRAEILRVAYQLGQDKEKLDSIYGGAIDLANASKEEWRAFQESRRIKKRINQLGNYLQEVMQALPVASVDNIIRDVKAGKVDEFGLNSFPVSTAQYYKKLHHRYLTTLYHEMGHHIHQQYGVISDNEAKNGWQSISRRYYSPPIEKVLSIIAQETVYQDSQDINGVDGHMTSLKHISTYSLSKLDKKTLLEWFAENFSYWAMDKYEGVAPLGSSERVLDPQFIIIMINIHKKGSDAYEL